MRAEPESFDPKIDIHAAIKLAGSQSDLARIVGVSKQSVYDWKVKGGPIPPLYAYRLARRAGFDT